MYYHYLLTLRTVLCAIILNTRNVKLKLNAYRVNLEAQNALNVSFWPQINIMCKILVVDYDEKNSIN